MIAAGFLLPGEIVFAAGVALQGAGPTVGDTIWLTRTVPLPAGYSVRAAEWEPSEPVQLLARARVLVTGDSAEVAYPVVVWQPGRHLVELPGPLLLGPGGTVDSLGPERVRLDLRSVLPAVPPDSALSPQPRAALVPRKAVSLVPLALLFLASLVFLLPVHLWWRRRGKPTRGAPLTIPPEALQAPLARWADAGEHRAVAHLATAQLRAALAELVPAAHTGLDTERVLAELAAARPEWPLEELGELLRSLDDARFGVAPSSEALKLSRSSLELRDRLLRNAA
jgi:hypothetical protein